MSALARYFLHEGKAVAGYDRTPSPLTDDLQKEGAPVHFEDHVELIPAAFRDPADTLVIYTPAVPHDHAELNWFLAGGFTVEKRSRALGHLSAGKFVMAVAGTHGKTTTTTLTAWLNHVAGGGGSAFLGGISKNFDSNLVLGAGDRLAVEADEYDRSFLQLSPDVAVITSTDADHLDIYGTVETMREAFAQFAVQTRRAVIVKLGAKLNTDGLTAKVYRYAYDTPCDFYAANIALREGGYYSFDLVTPGGIVADCTLGIPGWVNIENAVAASALLWAAGQAPESGAAFDPEKLREALRTFAGVKRRFEFYINTPQRVYMDDYAHHPTELHAAITSLRGMFPGREITAVFQPHLYTRTRDFYKEFAQELSLADKVILLPIYPAREEPIPGVDSQMIARLVTVPCTIVAKEDIVDYLAGQQPDVAATFGAGDIDRYCADIAKALK
jgi:UDP-N-acetylmuramate--alanine ligase